MMFLTFAGSRRKLMMMRDTIIFSILTAMLFLNVSCRRSINEIYLIPRGFSGNIAVVFDVKEGEKEVWEKGRRVYRIPEDGILITQASYDNHYYITHDEKFFFVDEGGERIPISYAIRDNNKEELKRLGLSDDEVFSSFNGSAGFGNIGYSLHYVGNRKGMEASEKDWLSSKDWVSSESKNLSDRVYSKVEKLAGKDVWNDPIE